jgi:hypothetical protein
VKHALRDAAEQQSRDRAVPASAHDDQIRFHLPGDVRDLMRGLRPDVMDDPETRLDPFLRELLGGLLELGLHVIFVGIHRKSGLRRVVLDDVDHDNRGSMVVRKRPRDFERLVCVLGAIAGPDGCVEQAVPPSSDRQFCGRVHLDPAAKERREAPLSRKKDRGNYGCASSLRR